MAITFVVASYIYFSNRRSLFNILMAIFLLDASLWDLMLILTSWSSSTLIGQTVFSFGGFFVPTFILFVIWFSGRDLTWKKVVPLILPQMIIAVLCPVNGLLFKEIKIVEGVIVTGKPGPLLPFFEFFYFAYILVAFYYLIRSYRSAERVKKVQLAYLLAGFILTIVSASITNMIMPMLGYFSVAAWGPLTTLPISLVMVYVATKHHIFETRVVLSELWSFLLVVIVFAAFWANRDIINLIILVIASGVGLLLVKSVLAESEERQLLNRQNAQLQKSKKDLETIDNLKEEFLQAASKELHTPIAAIEKIVQAIILDEESGFDQDQKKRLQPVLDASNRLGQLSHNFFEASFIEHGRIWLEKKESDIGKIAQRAVADQQKMAKNKNIDLIYEGSEDPLPKLLVDPEKIYKVVWHLIENAIKFSREGQVTVGTKRGGDLLMISVADTGIGIPKELQKNLFTKFFKLSYNSDNVSQPEQGAGLGLFISKSIVELHGGTIRVESEEGKGSKFTIIFPIKNQSGEANQEPVLAPSPTN